MKKKVLSILLILVILLCLCPDTRAYADTGVAFYLTHKHTGTQDICGGCYTSPHYHVHSEPGEGDCYTPRYHVHSGSPSGGGCYTVPVLHEHRGDGTSAEGCYVPQYHTHNSECYRNGICHWERTIRDVGLTPSWCYIHGDITNVDAIVTETHDACGLGSISGTVSYCPSCGYTGSLDWGEHTYGTLICTKGSSYVERYVLGCGHTEGDIDHYDPGCDMEGVIEGYDLTCTKTASHIDYYDPGCGMEDGQNAVAVRVTQDPVSGGSSMQLTVSLDDHSGGVIDISDADFIWTDAEGNEVGTGDSLTISSNGTYGLSVIISDPGINEDSCSGNVEVTGIRPPGSGNGNGGSSSGGDDGSGNGDEGVYDESGNANNGGSGGSSDDGSDDDMYYAVSTPTPTPTATPVSILNTGSGNGDGTETGRIESGSMWRNDDAYSGPDGTDQDALIIGQAIPFDGLNENVTVEKKKVEAEKADAGNEESLENGALTDDDQGKAGGLLGKAGQFLRTPAGKVITITVSTALLIGALFLLLLLLRNTIIVFNFDGHMKRHFTGITFIRLKKDGYELEIPDDICERAYTNRYVFFMGFFMIGRDPDTQIMVIKKDRQTMAKLERMMRVTI